MPILVPRGVRRLTPGLLVVALACGGDSAGPSGNNNNTQPPPAQPDLDININPGASVSPADAFSPDPIEVPAGIPVTFRITSSDVVHGFAVAGTNANTMVMPGYVSQFTYTFKAPGEYPIVCNEYCGLMHHAMTAKLIVKERPR